MSVIRMTMHRTKVRMALCMVTVCLTTTSVLAAVDPNIGLREDGKITHLVDQLEARLAKRGDLRDATRVTLLRDDDILCTTETHAWIRNTLVKLIGKPSGNYERAFALPASASLADVQIYVVRNGKVRRPGDGAWREEGGGGSRRLVFRPTDLEKDDVVGMSFEEKYEGSFGGSRVPLWEGDPVIMARLRVGGSKEICYRIEGRNLTRDHWSLKTLDEREGMPVDLRLTTADIAAGVDGGEAPWSALPFLAVSHRATWVAPLNAWFETTSWNEVAVGLSQILASTDDDVAAFQGEAARIAGAAEDPAEKAARLHDWVRDTYEVVDPFDRTYERGKLSALLGRRRASAREKVMLLYMLGRNQGLPFEILATRGRDFGAVRRGQPDLIQFTDLVLRLPGAEPTYFCPVGAAAVAGSLPENLQGCDAMQVKSGLREEMEELRREVMNSGAATPAQGIQAYRDKIRGADFATWEKLP